MIPLGISVVRADESYIYGKYYYYDGPTVYIEITAINCQNSKWRISGRHSLNDYDIYYSGDGLGSFSFDSENNKSYILQIQNWNGDWVNTTNMNVEGQENSIINVSFESGGSSSGGSSGSGNDGSGSTVTGHFYMYLDQGIGTNLSVIRTWSDNADYVGTPGGGVMTNGKPVWFGTDIFEIEVSATDGYSDATVQYQNLSTTSDGRYTMTFPGNIYITSSATDNSGSPGSGSSNSTIGKRGAYIGIDNIAHRIKGGYIGVDGLARKIKTAYVGIGGVARPCWKFDGRLSYWGQLGVSLDPPRSDFAATTVGNYALIGGGYQDASWLTPDTLRNVDIISNTLTKSYISGGLGEPRRQLVATHTNNVAFFAGGSTDANMIYEDVMSTLVEGFNSSMQRIGNTNALSSRRIGIAASHIGSYAMFAGGTNYSTYFNTVDVYNSSLTKESNCYLSSSKSGVAATHTYQHVLFAGGWRDSGRCAMVDAYNKDRTKICPSNLSSAREHMAAVHVGGFAIFAGGYDSSYPTTTVDVYDSSLSKIVGVAQNLSYSVARYVLPATSVQNQYAMFDLGEQYIYSENKNVYWIDVYDASLTKTILQDSGRLGNVDAHVGNYVITTSGGSINAFTIVPE